MKQYSDILNLMVTVKLIKEYHSHMRSFYKNHVGLFKERSEECLY